MGRLSFPYLSNRSLRPVLQNNEMTKLASARLGMIYLSKIMYKIALRPSYISVRPLCHSRTSSPLRPVRPFVCLRSFSILFFVYATFVPIGSLLWEHDSVLSFTHPPSRKSAWQLCAMPAWFGCIVRAAKLSEIIKATKRRKRAR